MPNETVRLLKDAKSVINAPENWIKGQLGNGGGGYCILGAMSKVWINSGGVKEDWYTIAGLMQACLPTARLTIARFNDHMLTTHADVMALFDRAIKKAEKEHG
jgi:hypothetical protein